MRYIPYLLGVVITGFIGIGVVLGIIYGLSQCNINWMAVYTCFVGILACGIIGWMIQEVWRLHLKKRFTAFIQRHKRPVRRNDR